MLRRRIDTNAICSQSGMEPESVEHVMFKCAKAQLVWRIAPVQWEGIQGFNDTFKEWWRTKGDSAQRNRMQERLKISAYIFWQLWKAGNESIFRGNEMSAQWI